MNLHPMHSEYYMVCAMDTIGMAGNLLKMGRGSVGVYEQNLIFRMSSIETIAPCHQLNYYQNRIPLRNDFI